MKKIILCIVYISIFSSLFQTANAFLGDEFSLNMYENIDEGINDLEESIYNKQLKTNRSGNIVNIEERVSELIDIEGIPNCFAEWPLTSTDIENISNGKINIAFESLSEGCKVDNSVGIDFFLNSYVGVIRELDEESTRIAEEQSKAISEIARVGIYSDGNDQNSPFDLIVDLQNINNIVFSTEIPFEGVNSESNNEIFECLAQKFEGTSDDIISSIEGSISNRDEAYLECETFSSSQNFGENFELEGLANGVEGGQDGNEGGSNVYGDIDFAGTSPDGNNLVCQDSSVHSGLSPEAISSLIESTGAGRDVVPISSFLPEVSIDENGNTQEGEAPEYPTPNYSKINDDETWPCNEYFCIRTEFKTKNYDLLTGGKTNSIEAIMERSNDHLKKAANSLLVQSKVTTNNFEMGWRDLSLPDMFNVGVQVQFIPPPILNLDQVSGSGEDDPETQALGDDFSLDNLLHSYFENAELDYSKQNDLERFKQTEVDRRNTLAAQELTTDRAIQSYRETNSIVAGYETEISKSILDKKANNEDISDFDTQFAEIERFSNAIKDYSVAASAIIKKMKEIPVFTNG